MNELLEKDRIIDRINVLFIATDDKRWEDVLACFTEEIGFDMSSAGGPPAARIAARDVVAAWQQNLAPIEKLHHQAGNYRVTVNGHNADAFCYGTATHYRQHPSGRNTRTFVGSYDFHLVRRAGTWLIDSFTFHLKYLDGNLELDT